MKKYLYLVVSVLLALTACTSEDFVDKVVADNSDTPTNVMGFNVRNKNMTRAATASLEGSGQYNFGVWAVKQSGATDSETYQTVMDNYLVGYNSGSDGYALANQPTYGTSNNLEDGISQWFYDGLGYEQYTNSTSPYIMASDETKMSNNANQYLKYWDYSSNKVDFYAYAPYVKGTKTPTYEDGKLTFPDYSAAGFMVASTTVNKGEYAKDVSLAFKRLGAVVKVKFWEDIPGYDVEMINYTLDNETGVVAQGNVFSGTGNTYVYDFTSKKGYFKDALTASYVTIPFTVPTGTSVAAKTKSRGHVGYNRIGCIQNEASPSPTEYGAVPVNEDVSNSELVFHVSFKLHSLDTDEVITVTNATATVTEQYTQWQSNTIYTYIFKITKAADGSTSGENGLKGLYPIVFDDIQVDNYGSDNSEWEINGVSMNQQLINLTSSTKKVTANMHYKDNVGLSYTFIWKSDHTEVATVKETTAATEETMASTATITAVAAGTADIKATNNDKSATCRVIVPLTISASSSVETGSSLVLTTNLPTSGTKEWTSSDDNVATVSDGTVTAVAEGTATITCTYTDAKDVVQTATCNVTVTATATATATP